MNRRSPLDTYNRVRQHPNPGTARDLRMRQLAAVLLLPTLTLSRVGTALVSTPSATPALPPTANTAAAQNDPSAVESLLTLDRSTRRLIQQGLRNEGFRPRHTGRPLRPADSRRDSRLAAVAPSVTDGVSERRGGRASSGGLRTAASGVGRFPASSGDFHRRTERFFGRATTRFPGGGPVQPGRSSGRRRNQPSERRRDALWAGHACCGDDGQRPTGP